MIEFYNCCVVILFLIIICHVYKFFHRDKIKKQVEIANMLKEEILESQKHMIKYLSKLEDGKTAQHYADRIEFESCRYNQMKFPIIDLKARNQIEIKNNK